MKDKLCEYGCGQIAKHTLKNGKLCCSESANSCPAMKEKNSKTKHIDKVCPYCHKEFKNINVKVFANHIRWCEKNPEHDKICGNKFKTKLSNTLKSNAIDKLGEFCDFEVVCANKKCQKHFHVKERKEKFPEKEHYFCSIKCAHSFIASNRSKKSRQKIGKTLKSKKHIINCQDCGKEIEVCVCVSKARCAECKEKYDPKYSKQKFIDLQGNVKYQSTRYDHEKELSQFQQLIENGISFEELCNVKKQVYRIYRVMCGFTFSLRDYPNEFDIQSLKVLGMYSAANHGNNKDGISRDHMYSCADGFKNNISPLIISHPANCQLITQHENASKRHKSSITLEQLLERIQIWEQKYGKYEKKNIIDIPKQLFEKLKDTKICHPMNFDGYELIYEISTLKMKWWNVKDLGIPDGWTCDCPLEIRESKRHFK